MTAVYIIIAVLVLLVIWYFSTYNSLISLRNRKDDQFTQEIQKAQKVPI